MQRGPAFPVTASFESVAATGFYGVFWQPPASHDNHIGVVDFDGDAPGVNVPPIGAMLAARGYPTLDLAYFGEPGLPQHPPVSLEYFAKTLRWLGHQPGVDPRRLWMMGWSLGSEAALLLGTHYPNLVHGVAALSPNNMVDCSWTFGGQPVPCAVAIPVAKIRGPVFLDCGGADASWPSCPQAKAVMAELAAARDSYPHELLDYPQAGHGIGTLLPYYPGLAADDPLWGIGGDTVVANPLARADQWPKLLAFLRN